MKNNFYVKCYGKSQLFLKHFLNIFLKLSPILRDTLQDVFIMNRLGRRGK